METIRYQLLADIYGEMEKGVEIPQGVQDILSQVTRPQLQQDIYDANCQEPLVTEDIPIPRIA